MRTTLAQFNETTSTDAFSLQNSKLLKVTLEQVSIQAKLGTMVAHQGDVRSEGRTGGVRPRVRGHGEHAIANLLTVRTLTEERRGRSGAVLKPPLGPGRQDIGCSVRG